jgi:uncharacterized protein YdhG (YjbR/CyaY superfamily)
MPRRRKPATVEEYIAAFEPKIRTVLRAVRRTVRAAAPGAHEVISYSMPALKQHGILVYFAAFARHIGFFPPIKGSARLEKAAKRYAGPKGNLRFPYDERIPYVLIAALTKLRARQDAAKGVSRRRAPRAKRSSRARR